MGDCFRARCTDHVRLVMLAVCGQCGCFFHVLMQETAVAPEQQCVSSRLLVAINRVARDKFSFATSPALAQFVLLLLVAWFDCCSVRDVSRRPVEHELQAEVGTYISTTAEAAATTAVGRGSGWRHTRCELYVASTCLGALLLCLRFPASFVTAVHYTLPPPARAGKNKNRPCVA